MRKYYEMLEGDGREGDQEELFPSGTKKGGTVTRRGMGVLNFNSGMISVCRRLGAVCPNKGYIGLYTCTGHFNIRGSTCVKCFKGSSGTRCIVGMLRRVKVRVCGYGRLSNRGK